MRVTVVRFFLLHMCSFAIVMAGCSARLADPKGAQSSLVVGRVIIDNHDSENGLPMGQKEHGIKLAIETGDKGRFAHIVTRDRGYFVIPNIPAQPYFLVPLFSIRDESNGDESDQITAIHQGFFSAPSGKVVDLGTFSFRVHKNARVASNFVPPNPKRAKAYLSTEFPKSPWLKKNFVGGSLRRVFSHRGKGYRFAGPPPEDWQQSQARFPDIEFRHNAGGGWIGAGGFKLLPNVPFARVNQWWVNSVSAEQDWSNIRILEEKDLTVAGLQAKLVIFELTDKQGGRLMERTYHIYNPGGDYDLYRIRLNSIKERYEWFISAVEDLTESFDLI